MAQSEGFSRGGFSNSRGGFNQPTLNDNQSNSGFASRDGFGSTRGSFGQSSDNNQESSGFGSTRGGGRGGSNIGRGGGFGQSNDNQESSGSASRGGFGSTRGSFGQSSDNNQESPGFGSTRSGFGSTRGSFGQSFDINQESPGFGSTRSGGRRESNNERGGGFCQSNDNQGNSGFASRGGFGQSDASGSTRGRGGFNQNGGGGRNCFKCQGEGHTARECPNAESARGNTQAGTEGAQQTNRADGETLPERAPMNFVPQARNVDELFSEDQQVANRESPKPRPNRRRSPAKESASKTRQRKQDRPNKRKGADNVFATIAKKSKTAKAVVKAKVKEEKMGFLIPKSPMYRLVKEIFQDSELGKDMKLKSGAFEVLRTAAEFHLVSYFEDMAILAAHAKRQTILPRDSITLKILKQPEYFHADPNEVVQKKK
uniref:CCHC-type domain-containing protein n=1 Tax=Panagrolaimus sp. PS1159 TaxID=55785 RepID=A0AC35GEW8_9BILA